MTTNNITPNKKLPCLTHRMKNAVIQEFNESFIKFGSSQEDKERRKLWPPGIETGN